MAEIQFKINLSGPMRKAIISAGADVVDALPAQRYAIILELLKRDPVSRSLIAEAMGEAALREQKHDAEQRALLDATDFQEGDVRDLTWDEIMLECLDVLQDTPGGRGEVEL